MIKFVLTLLLASLLLSACGQNTLVVRSQRQEQAIELNQRAQRAFTRGEYQTAEGLYGDALRLDVAIENADGIAINLLNLAKVSLALERPKIAEYYLDRILKDKALQFPVAHLASASLQYSLLRLRAGDVASAISWVDKASEYCVSDCKLSGVIANLRANIAIQSNDVEQALYWSGHAVSSNKSESKIEYANALRLHGQAKMLKQEFEASISIFDEALNIDKSLGLPDKIRLDLMFLAQASDKLGRTELAAQYRERAARVAATLLK
jgi:tetratricopeptide (TPR) repeat protein